MTSGVTFVLMVITTTVLGFESVQRSPINVAENLESEMKTVSTDEGTETLKKSKRWIPTYQDIAVDYPEFEDPYGETQLAEVARPFSASGSPGGVLLYRSGSRRPSGAITRTVLNPPSGLIPRVLAAAKAAFATLTGPQTVLSRTTYLSPPRPPLTAILPQQAPQVPVALPGSEPGSSTTNAAAAAAAAAAAVAAVTRSIYEAGHRGGGFITDKGGFLPPISYNNYGLWPEIPKSQLSYHHTPELSIRLPQEYWNERVKLDTIDPHLRKLPLFDFYGNHLTTNPLLALEPARIPWPENHVNKVQYNHYGGWADATNFRENQGWSGYSGSSQGTWSQDGKQQTRDAWAGGAGRKTPSFFGRVPGGNGGFAEATADTPPNGDSWADAKVTANGASAIAAAVWTRNDLGSGVKGRTLGDERRVRNDNEESRYYLDDFDRGIGGHRQEYESRLRLAPREVSSSQQLEGKEKEYEYGEKTNDANKSQGFEENESKLTNRKCSNGVATNGCIVKANAERLRAMFPSRRKA